MHQMKQVLNFMKKFNFKHAGTIENVGYKFERWLDLAFYQYDLNMDNNS